MTSACLSRQCIRSATQARLDWLEIITPLRKPCLHPLWTIKSQSAKWSGLPVLWRPDQLHEKFTPLHRAFIPNARSYSINGDSYRSALRSEKNEPGILWWNWCRIIFWGLQWVAFGDHPASYLRLEPSVGSRRIFLQLLWTSSQAHPTQQWFVTDSVYQLHMLKRDCDRWDREMPMKKSTGFSRTDLQITCLLPNNRRKEIYYWKIFRRKKCFYRQLHDWFTGVFIQNKQWSGSLNKALWRPARVNTCSWPCTVLCQMTVKGLRENHPASCKGFAISARSFFPMHPRTRNKLESLRLLGWDQSYRRTETDGTSRTWNSSILYVGAHYCWQIRAVYRKRLVSQYTLRDIPPNNRKAGDCWDRQ